jgi:hypothetical protein
MRFSAWLNPISLYIQGLTSSGFKIQVFLGQNRQMLIQKQKIRGQNRKTLI